MAVKAWFDYETYMSNKLNQMVKAEPQAGWTADSLKAAFEKAGFVGDTGAQQHFLKWGHKEDVSPNKMFDADYYYQAKALAYYTSTEAGSAQVAKEVVLADLAGYGDKMEAIIKGAGMDAWTHYTKYGTKEGINPSNDFDTSNYMAAKIAAMNGTMTADEVYAAFKKAGMNALAHAEMYAGKGGQETAAAANTFVVPEDEKLPETGGDGTQLTVGIDNLSGTHFVANPVVNSLGDVKQTLNTNDTLKGTGDDNSLDVLWSGGTDNGQNMNAQNVVTPNMTNIQTLNLSNVGDAALVINGNNVQGLTTITNTDSIRNFTVNNLAKAVENVSIKGTATDTTVNMQPTAMTGTEDALNLTVEDLRANSSFTTSNGYEILNVTTQNSASVMDKIVTPGVKTATFAGDQDLTLRGNEGNAAVAPLSDTIAKIDASALTGKFALGSVDVRNTSTTQPGDGFSGAFTSNAAKVEITTGSGDDTLVIGDLDKDYSIDAGEGTDTLYVTDALRTGIPGNDNPNSVATAPTIKGVEKLAVVRGNGQGVTENVSLELKGVEGLQELILGAQGDATKVVALKNMTHNADANFTITAVGDGTTDPQTFNGVTYSPFGTVADDAKLTMNISNQGKDAAITTGTLNFGKVENVTMNVADVAHDADFNVDIDTALETFNFTVDDGDTVDLGTLGINGSLKALTLDSAATTTNATISQMGGGLATLHGRSDFNLTFTQPDNRGMTVDSSDATGQVTLSIAAPTADPAAAESFAVVGGAGNQILQVVEANPNVALGNATFNFTGGEGNDTIILSSSVAIGGGAAAAAEDNVFYTSVGQGGAAVAATRGTARLTGGDTIGDASHQFVTTQDHINLSAILHGGTVAAAAARGGAWDLDVNNVILKNFDANNATDTVAQVSAAIGTIQQDTQAAGTFYALLGQTAATEYRLYEITLDGTHDYSTAAAIGEGATIALLGTITTSAALVDGDVIVA